MQGTGSRRRFRIGADIGGTFTDIVLVNAAGQLHTKKIASTPDNYGRAIVTGITELIGELGLEAADLSQLVHACTIATNAILELKGAKTALITTRGFRDVLEMRRLRIPVLYDLQYEKPPPLVPRRLRLEISERLGARGKVLQPLDEFSVRQALEALRAENVGAVAIALLHSYANASHERRVAQIAREMLSPHVYITCSADILPEIREYERTSTAVVNAYVGPIARDYIAALDLDIRRIGVTGALQIMQSNGGVMTAEAAVRRPAYLTESGPAAGVIACAHLARALELQNVISFDMGGTTAKAAMIEGGEPAKTTEYEVGAGINLSSKLVKGGGYPIKLPFIDVSEIGAGGGSIVAVDAGGGLRVGPRSAGAVPGPVCYGNGGAEPTFTDAMVVLGYLNPDAIAGGQVKLNATLAREALQAKVANALRLPLIEAAQGIHTIAAATMTRAVKAVTTYRGRDPRDFTLVAFGGNGPIAAVAVAEALSIRKVLVPPAPGVFSAVGLLLADIEQEFTASVLVSASSITEEGFAQSFTQLEESARAAMVGQGHAPEHLRVKRVAELRYGGQAYELSILVHAEEAFAVVLRRFHQEYFRTYGHRSEVDPVEVVAIRVFVRVEAAADTLDYAALARQAISVDKVRLHSMRRAYFGNLLGFVDTPVISRGILGDAWVDGPLIVEEYDATCVVPPGSRARIDRFANIEVEVEQA